MSPNRVVALLTPLVFAPLAGSIAAWLATNVPGTNITSDQLTGIFITGALIAFGKSAQWLHGWQKWEEGQTNATVAADQADAAAAAAGAPALALAPAAEEDGFGELGLADVPLEEELGDGSDLGDGAFDEDPLLDGQLQPTSN
jgi:hypothetical protein